jgi:hypothetical protein
MIALVERIASGHSTRESVRRETAKPRPAGPGRPKAYVFNYRPTTKAFTMKLQFRKGNVERQEIIETLEGILAELRQS